MRAIGNGGGRWVRGLFARVLSAAQLDLKARAVVWDGVLLASAQIGVGIASLLTITLLARNLGPPAFGQWQLAVAASAYLVILASLGTSQYGTWLAARTPGAVRGIVAGIMPPRVVASLGIVALWSVIVGVAGVAADRAPLLVLAAMAALLRALWPDWLLQGIRRAVPLALLTFAYPAAALVGVWLLVDGASDVLLVPIVQLVLGLLLGVVAWLVALVSARGSSSRGGAGPLPKILRECLPLAVASLLIQVVTNMDYILIGVLRSDADTAVYAAASVIAIFVHGVGIAFHGAVFPSLAAAVGNREQVIALIRRLASIALFFALPAAAGLAVLSPQLIYELYGNAYAESVVPLQIMALYVPLGVYGTFFTNLLVAQGHRGYYATVFAVGAAVNVLVNLLVIPPLGGRGAALTTLLSVATITLLSARRAGVGFPVSRRLVLPAFLGSCVILLLLPSTAGAPIAVRVVAGILLYGLSATGAWTVARGLSRT